MPCGTIGSVTRPGERELSDGVVTLRSFVPSDVDDLTAACQDREISRGTISIPWPYEERHAVEWLATHASSWADQRVEHFATVDAVDGRLLGSISVVEQVAEDRCVVGYWVAAPERRRGVATRALRLVCSWAFESTPSSSVMLRTLLGNVGSELVAQRAGFTLVGDDPTYENRAQPGVAHHVRLWALPRPASP